MIGKDGKRYESLRPGTHLTDLAELHILLERARYDLEQSWPEAAYDCIGRALRLLGESA